MSSSKPTAFGRPPIKPGVWEEIREWFKEQPTITKWHLVFAVTFPLLLTFRLLSVNYLLFDVRSLVKSAQVWRVFTPFFITKVSVQFVLSLVSLYQQSKYLETITFGVRPADYLYFMILSASFITVFPFCCLVITS